MNRRELVGLAVAGVIGAGVLWGLTSLFVFALSPEMGTP